MSHSSGPVGSLAPGTWKLDKSHSSVGFDIRFLGLTDFPGRFDRFDATFTVTRLGDVQVEADIDIASFNTNLAGRDGHLLAPDLLNAGEHPMLKFTSTAIKKQSENFGLEGTVTFRGISRPITLDVDFGGTTVHPVDGKLRSGFVAHGELNRSDFGMSFNIPLAAEKLALSDSVNFTINALFFAPE